MKFVTEPEPPPEPVKVHVVPEQLPAPLEKLNVKAPGVPLIDETLEDEAQPEFVKAPFGPFGQMALLPGVRAVSITFCASTPDVGLKAEASVWIG